MGMNARLLAIGKFRKEIAPYLEYGETFYNNVSDDAIICTCVIECNTTNESDLLAESIKCSPWDFEKHFIKNSEVDERFSFDELKEFFPEYYNNIMVLKSNGFDFIYMPNG